MGLHFSLRGNFPRAKDADETAKEDRRHNPCRCIVLLSGVLRPGIPWKLVTQISDANRDRAGACRWCHVRAYTSSNSHGCRRASYAASADADTDRCPSGNVGAPIHCHAETADRGAGHGGPNRPSRAHCHVQAGSTGRGLIR